MAATLITGPPVADLYGFGDRTSRLDHSSRAASVSQRLMRSYAPALPPVREFVLPRRARHHERREYPQRQPCPLQRERMMQRERNESVDHLDVDPVHEQRRSAER